MTREGNMVRKTPIVAVILAILAASSVRAAPAGSSAAPGAGAEQSGARFTWPDLEVYLSFVLSRPALQGGFNGVDFYSGAGLVLLVPEVQPALGFGMELGAKRKMGRSKTNALGAMIYVVRSHHNGTWMDVPGDGVLWDVGVGLAWHMMARRRVQPYLRGTFAFTGFDFNVDETLGLDTCPFAGTKWAFGIGASIYLTPQWFLDIGVSRSMHRFGAPADIRSIVLDPPVSSSTFDFESRISFRF